MEDLHPIIMEDLVQNGFSNGKLDSKEYLSIFLLRDSVFVARDDFDAN